MRKSSLRTSSVDCNGRADTLPKRTGCADNARRSGRRAPLPLPRVTHDLNPFVPRTAGYLCWLRIRGAAHVHSGRQLIIAADESGLFRRSLARARIREIDASLSSEEMGFRKRGGGWF